MASATTTVFVLSAIPLAAGSYWFTSNFLARLRQTQDTGKVHAICFFLLFFAMSTLFVVGSFSTLKRMYDLATKPTYDAVITGYTSEWHESQSNDGRTIGNKQLMYTAQLAFKDRNGQQVNIANSVQANSIPAVGDQITVVYAPGDKQAQEKSFRSVLLLGVSVFLLALLGFALLASIAYARNQPMQQFMQLSATVFGKLIVPGAVLAIAGMLWYVPFQYLILGNPLCMAKWAMLVCLFFAMMMLPLIYNLIVGLFGRNNAP